MSFARLSWTIFAEHGHRVQPGISLVPTDPSILLTTAGVVPFRAIIEGRERAPYAARGDLPALPPHHRHRERRQVRPLPHLLRDAGQLLVRRLLQAGVARLGLGVPHRQVLGLDPDRIWATIYQPARSGRRRAIGGAGSGREVIGPAGAGSSAATDNFWGPVAETGACGPDSEIYYDLGEEFGCGRAGLPAAAATATGTWSSGTTSSPSCYKTRGRHRSRRCRASEHRHRHGAGAADVRRAGRAAPSTRRTCSARSWSAWSELAGQRSRRPRSARRTGASASSPTTAGRSRSWSMDGIYPSNEGRGYVLRRMLRRAGDVRPAARHPAGRSCTRSCRSSSSRWAAAIRSCVEKQEVILQDRAPGGRAVRRARWSRACACWSSAFAEAGAAIVPGETAFRLYDTYGFPLELTREMAAERGLTVDEAGFDRAHGRSSATERRAARRRSRPRRRALGLRRSSSDRVRRL